MFHKGVQYAGQESRMLPGQGSRPEEEFTSRPGVIYLRDAGGQLYATVHAALGDLPVRGWKSADATKLRHRRSGRTYTVANVEAMTRMVRLEEDVDFDGMPMRTRWYPVEEFDVLGLPVTPQDARSELDAIKARQAELERLLHEEEPQPPPLPESAAKGKGR